MSKPIYLDHMATTPMATVVCEQMLAVMDDYANPSAQHIAGQQAVAHINLAAQELARVINVKPHEIIWTSGATEANNLALKGAAMAYARRGKHIIVSAIEHPSVRESANALVKLGFSVSDIAVDEHGRLDIMQLRQALREDTILVSIMWVNNEIGVVNDIVTCAQIVKQHGALFHVDGAQALGRVAIDLQSIPIDLLSLSAHKCYGPKGIGALYVRSQPKVRLQAQLHGGAQQQGLRAGTLPTPLIVGMARAASWSYQQYLALDRQLACLRDRLWQGIADLPGIIRNGEGVSSCLNVCFSGIEGEALHWLLAETITVSSGSACHAAKLSPSTVLLMLGRGEKQSSCAIRFALGFATTAQDIEDTIVQVRRSVLWLAHLSPYCALQSIQHMPSRHCSPGTLLTYMWQSQHVGQLPEPNKQVCSGHETLGVTVEWTVCFDKRDTIIALNYQVYGCPISIALCAYCAEQLLGQTRVQCSKMNASSLMRQFSIDPRKQHCVILIVEALHQLGKE